MKDIYLIRHAQSVANLTPEIIGGRSNHSPTSESGIEQIFALKRRLEIENLVFDAAFSSPAVRAQDIAMVTHGPNYLVVDDLQELDQGDWTGRVRDDVITPELMAIRAEDPHNFKAPNGESQFEVGKRMLGAVMRYGINAEYNKIAFYTHGVAIKCLLHETLGIRKDAVWRIPIENTSITQLGYADGIWYPKRINDYAHLRIL